MSSKEPKILVVDDSNIDLMIIQKLLRYLDIEIHSYTSPEKALQQLYDDHDYALAILDVQMPGMDGFQLAKKIREERRLARIPIIFVSSTLTDKFYQTLGLDAGAVDYIPKSALKEFLPSKVRSFLEIYEYNRQLCSEIEKRKAVEQSLRKSEERYRGIVESQKSLVLRFSEDFDIIFVNDAFCSLIQKEKSDLMGQKANIFLQVNKSSLTDIRDLLTEDDNKVIISETNLQLPGKNIWIEWEYYAIRDNNSKILEFQAIGHDKTIERKASENLISILSKEKELSAMKSNVIMTISHQFRTPLTIISTSMALMEEKLRQYDLQNEMLLYSQRIWKSITRITTMLDEALVYGRAVSGSVELKMETINLLDFCKSIIKDIKFIASKHNFIISLDDSSNKNILTDAIQNKYILNNLLNNAVKFSKNGSNIWVDVSLRNNIIEYRIKDEGIGIPEEIKSTLYKPFIRGENAQLIDGSGFGLSIVKSSVELLNGEISFESELGKGSVFYVKIPALYPEE